MTRLLCALALAMGSTACGVAGADYAVADQTAQDKTAQSQASQNQASSAVAAQEKDEGLVIETPELPVTYPRGPYLVVFRVRGNYVPVLHWKLMEGALPPGIKLDDHGVLRGEAERAGEFRFVVSVQDSGKPQQAVQRGFVIRVVEAITLEWKVPAHVTGNRIDGSVEVSNTTADDVDLTFDVKAVAENGRATEIGYQHFPLKRGTIGMTLPFGETLPHGAYVVHVDVVGEVAKRNAIYRQRMQTPGALQVVVGP
jgi:hypothetical protein